MFKSASEQLQIKKKRKHNNNNTLYDNTYNCSYNNNNNNNNNNNSSATPRHVLGEKRKFNDVAFVFPAPAPLLAADADGDTDTDADVNGSSKYQKPPQCTNNNNSSKNNNPRDIGCLREQRQHLQPTPKRPKMPLSQGFLHSNNSSNNNSSSHSNKNNNISRLNNNKNIVGGAMKRRLPHPAVSNAGAGLALDGLRTPDAKRRSGENRAQLAAAYSNYNSTSNGKSNSNSNNNKLQLSYLLGESLARCGRLQEAFDVYAIIAQEHREGFVPLDRLSTLAARLVTHVRQQQQQQQQQEAEEETSAKFAWTTTRTTGGGPLLGAAEVEAGAGAEAPAALELCGVAAPPDDWDPLLCPLCQDILRCPVTTNCGHTFCRQCCEAITMCNICLVKFPRSNFDDHAAAATATATATATASATVTTTAAETATQTPTLFGRLGLQQQQQHLTVTTTTVASTTATATTTMASTSSGSALASATLPSVAAFASTTAAATATSTGTARPAGVDSMKFMPDVLVRRLVEKWWGADLQAKKINETAASYMHLNLLDDALRFCNASLEKSPTNFKSLLLRAEVLRKLNHFQSSLADVDNALKSRFTSAKAHYQRSLALAELGRYEEALYDNCLAISLDKSGHLTMSELFQHDLAKLLQKLLAQAPKGRAASHRAFAPYSVLAEQRQRQRLRLLAGLKGGRRGLGAEDVDVDAEDVDVDVEEFELMDCDKRYADLLGAEEVGVIDDVDADMDVYVEADEELMLAMGGCYGEPGWAGRRRPSSRKPCRRKWATKERELVPRPRPAPLYDGHCGHALRSVLSRTQQELQRLRKLEQASAGEGPQRQGQGPGLGPGQVQVSPGLIDASDFDCVLCCRTFWKPVVTPCGHTYCWVCLDRCMDYTSSCPLCMSPLVEPFNINAYPPGSSSPVPFALAKRPVTKFLEAAMKRFIPESYARRLRQEMDLEPSVPVFICTTAFPHVPCPLFVYEPRYRLMVRRAVDSGAKQFGIVQPHGGKARYFDVGTILDIRDCVLLGDGCSILSTVGCRRFRILARGEKDGYETAKVEYIHDEPIAEEGLPFVAAMHAVVLRKAAEWFASLSTELKQEILQSFGAMPPLEDGWERVADGPAWAWWIIALLPLSQQLKVDILATTSLEKRLRAIEKTLDYLSGSLRRSQQSCSVVVQQHQQQQQHHQQQHQQHRHHHPCDHEGDADADGELAASCQSDECCQRATDTLTLAPGSASTPANSSEQHSPLLL